MKVVVGSDVPALDAAYVEEALARLARADAVLGPVEDGGYCLIGMNEPHPELFRSIEWSTDSVLEQTLERAAAAGLDVALLDTLWDRGRLCGLCPLAEDVVLTGRNACAKQRGRRFQAAQVDSEMRAGCETLASDRSSASDRTCVGGDHA